MHSSYIELLLQKLKAKRNKLNTVIEALYILIDTIRIFISIFLAVYRCSSGFCTFKAKSFLKCLLSYSCLEMNFYCYPLFRIY